MKFPCRPRSSTPRTSTLPLLSTSRRPSSPTTGPFSSPTPDEPSPRVRPPSTFSYPCARPPDRLSSTCPASVQRRRARSGKDSYPGHLGRLTDILTPTPLFALTFRLAEAGGPGARAKYQKVSRAVTCPFVGIWRLTLPFFPYLACLLQSYR